MFSHVAAKRIAIACLTFAAALLPGAVSAHEYKIGNLVIDHPWSRVTPKGAKVAGGYMKITNTGTEPDRLVGGTFLVSKRLEIHEMAMDGGVMKMRELDKGLEIKPGEAVELKPGGYHVMFMELTGELEEGKTVKGTLVFQKAGTIEVEYKVEPRSAKAGGHDHGGHGQTKPKAH